MNIRVHGIDFRRAPVGTRECVSLSSAHISRMLRIIRDESLADESLILSTCNRTEFYLAGRAREDVLDCLLAHVGGLKGGEPLRERALFYNHTGREAIHHLFRTGASLDSQAPGEAEILGQLKAAYRLAIDAGTARFLLNRTLHRAFRTAKRVVNETGLFRGAASIPTAAVEMLKTQIGDPGGATILIVGAGKTAGAALRVLVDAGARRGFCANRNVRHANRMLDAIRHPRGMSRHHQADNNARRPASKEVGFSTSGIGWQAVALKAIPDVIGQVDGVISATGAGGFVLKHSQLADVIGRRSAPLCIVDIAVPRDVDPALGDLPGVRLKTIDDLDEVIARSMHRRMAELPGAEAIVDEEVEKFFRWADSLKVAPTIKKLNDFAAGQRELEIQRCGSAYAGVDTRESLSRFADALCAKLLHRPFEYLNRISFERSESDLMAALDLIHEMFGLDDPGNGEKA